MVIRPADRPGADVRPGAGRPSESARTGDGRAVTVADGGRDPSELLSELGLLPPSDGRPVLFLGSGIEDTPGPGVPGRAVAAFAPAVGAAAEAAGAAVVDGGNSCDAVAALRGARSHRPGTSPVLLGAAPAGEAALPDSRQGARVPQDSPYARVVLLRAPGQHGVTDRMPDVATALAGGGQIVMVLVGGGQEARAQALEAVRRKWPVFAVEGTGGAAQCIADQWHVLHRQGRRFPGPPVRARLRRHRDTSPSSDRAEELAEILHEGDIRPVPGDDSRALALRLAWELQEEPVLKAAWQVFAGYDRMASRTHSTFQRVQASILVLGVLATLLALVDAEVGGRRLHWLVVVVPITVSVLIAWSSRRADGRRWIMLRAAAEEVKAEIYRYRTRTHGYAPERSGGRAPSLRQRHVFENHLKEIETRLVRTEAGSAPLVPYEGPWPPAACRTDCRDDGLSPLDAERYIRVRLEDQVAYYHSRVRHLDRLRTLLEVLAISAGGAGALLAAFKIDIWIGLTSGISTAALACLAYVQADNSIVAYNRAAISLSALKRAWEARSPHERNRKAFTRLVGSTEEVLSRERAGWVHQMSEALQELRDRQDTAAAAVQEPEEAAGAAPSPYKRPGDLP